MYIVNSKNVDKSEIHYDDLEISKEYLQYVVESIAIPRHYISEKNNNIYIGKWIKNEFIKLGYESSYQGSYRNIVSTYKEAPPGFKIIIGAHYDSVPSSPGADDNGSAIAGMLAIAKALKEFKDLPLLFVAFNREEDGLLGSQEFVESLFQEQTDKIECVHILEMIGYCSSAPNSQLVPEGLPVKISDVGDFIGVIANQHSNNIIKQVIATGKEVVPTLPIKALKAFLGVEKFFPHLLRSDHAPFWASKIPALMWTDTSEFRNPNYHKHSDTPDTLNYTFMEQVTKLLGNLVVKQLDISKD